MLKILEALAMFWIGHMSKNDRSHHPATVPGLGIEFVMSKSREFALLSMAGIVLAVLFSGGIMLGLVGLSFWLADNSGSEFSHIMVYAGGGLTLACGAVASFVFSKKRFNLVEPEKKLPSSSEHPARPPGAQIVEELVMTLIKDFVKEKDSTVAASTPTPTSTHPA